MPAGLSCSGRALLITTDTVGGIWNYSLALAAGMAERGVRCTLAVLGPPPDRHQVAQAAAVAGCVLVETGLRLDWTVADRAALDREAGALAGLAARSGAKSAHLHAPCFAATAWPVPVVSVVHSCLGSWWAAVRGGVMPAALAWQAKATLDGMAASDAVLAPSAALAADLRLVYPGGPPIRVVHNGITGHGSSVIARGRSVLAAGRLWDAGKNIAVLDRAATRMRAAVRVAGALCGPDGACMAFAHVDCLGHLPPARLHAEMAGAAVFAAPSRYEPFGLGVLEAACVGTPLVLSDIPTFRELWSGAAVLVPPEDDAAWAAALDGLVADAPRRAALGAAARARAARYTREAMVAGTLAIHDGVLDRARQAA